MNKSVIVVCSAVLASLLVVGLATAGYFKHRLDLLGNQIAATDQRAPTMLISTSVVPSDVILDHEVPRQIGDIVKAATAEELKSKRAELIQYIWSGSGLPKGDRLVSHPISRANPFGNYHASELYVDVGLAGISKPIFVQAERSKGCLFVYHSGHEEGTSPAQPDAHLLMSLALVLGCDVIHSSMPNDGDNKQAEVVGDHNWLGEHETENFTPLRWFLDPALQSIDWALSKQSYKQIIVAGRSGGGWTAGLLGALDPRINTTVVINGSMPFFVKGHRVKDIGDWEQTSSRIYNKVDYGDLYLLSAFEEGRTAYYSWNKYDTCCYAGARARVFFPVIQHQAALWGITGLNFHVDDDLGAGHTITSSSIGAVAKMILSR